jgi:hypothetical protein
LCNVPKLDACIDEILVIYALLFDGLCAWKIPSMSSAEPFSCAKGSVIFGGIVGETPVSAGIGQGRSWVIGSRLGAARVGCLNWHI